MIYLLNFILPIALFLNQNSPQEKVLFYQDMEYEAKVKSTLIQKKGSDERFPLMNLNEREAFTFSFDYLEAENDYFQYTYIHCDKDWKPSRLNQTDYLKGNMFEEIETFKFSSNTYVQYTHYTFNFPTAKMYPRLAGNYILKIYRNFDEEDVIITRRFMVMNNRVEVNGTVNSATNVNLRFTHQEIDFKVNAEKFTMPNPFQDLHAVVLKNNSWMHATAPIKPQFANNNVYTFNYEIENTVNGLNEFRFFDVRGLRTFASGVKSKYFDSSAKQTGVQLFTDQCRGGQTYLYWKDNNGKSVYANRDLPNIANSEDYLLVDFSLSPNALIEDDAKIYVLGEFNNWRPSPATQMVKNSNGVYAARLSLKQGYYNYIYGVQGKDGSIEFGATEGEHMETENDYRVMVYHKNQFLQYDELVGFLYLNSLYANKK